ncbi:MAG: hypothetical protein HN356_10965 [Calditrichaeota bacterium]|nr:hypothetical protein [Calditrichota bacterium]MBT7618559.1 hypothetical protein [Calditrichota bacterium]MBT7788571.1 hypothetical protein [Calditrichota bacterium]
MKWEYKVDKQVRSLDEILTIAEELVQKYGPYKVSVAAGEDVMGLGGIALGKERGMIDPILVGHPRRIADSLEKLGHSTDGWTIVDEKDENKATAIAARQVLDKEADVLMRGKLLAYDFMKVLLSRDLGIRKRGDLWTNIVLTKLDVLDRLLLITDPAVIVNADLTKRLQHLQVVLNFANFLGIEEPKVALLAAVETVSPSIPVSLEEAVISMMCERGQFAKGIQVDGPLSLDLAINMESVKKKRVESKVAGKADILVVNNLGIGNLLFKSLITLCGGISASVIVGLPFPVVLTSRSESPENIQHSLAMSIMMAGGK